MILADQECDCREQGLHHCSIEDYVLSCKGFPGRTTTCMNTGNGYEALGVHGHCITMRSDITFGLAGLVDCLYHSGGDESSLTIE
jgi:hypothetical protein